MVLGFFLCLFCICVTHGLPALSCWILIMVEGESHLRKKKEAD